MSVGLRLRDFRQTKKLTQQDVADSLGVSKVTVIRWENGSAKPSPLAAQKLQELGLGTIELHETNLDEVPRIRLAGKQLPLFAAEASDYVSQQLQVSLPTRLKIHGKPYEVTPSPYVINGPANQIAFFERLIELQGTTANATNLPRDVIAERLSVIQSVGDLAPSTSQHRLESPRQHAAHWNANYGPHGWHRYIGRFPPHLVRALLNHFQATPDTVVCDPFAGSGTTLVECRLLGIPVVGVEICPLSYLISKVKSTFPSSTSRLRKVITDFRVFYCETMDAFLQGRGIQQVSHAKILARPTNPLKAFANCEKWLTAEAMLGTSVALEFAVALKGYEQDAFLVALSSKTRSIGNVDVDVARAEYRKTPRSNVDVLGLVSSALKGMCDDIDASVSSHAKTIGPSRGVTLLNDDVLSVDLPPNSVDCVITSPPYGVEASSYLRSHLLSYRCLESFLHEDPYAFGDRVIGSEYVCDAEAGSPNFRCANVSKTFHSFFSECLGTSPPKKLLQRAHMMMHFFDDMSRVAEKLSLWVKKGGKVAFVVGNKKIGEHLIPTDEIVAEVFESHGFRSIEKLSHKLKCNNSNSQVPWQEHVIQDEFILFFSRK